MLFSKTVQNSKKYFDKYSYFTTLFYCTGNEPEVDTESMQRRSDFQTKIVCGSICAVMQDNRRIDTGREIV